MLKPIYTMDGPHLPFDILVSILDISCPSTIATCMQTCHALYRHGAKPLLDWGVALALPTDFVSFLKFMRADEKFRFQHLQKLEIIQCPTAHCDAMDALHQLITHPLVSIHTLVLGDAEETLKTSTHLHGSTQTLPAALCALTTLRHLTVSTCGPQTSAFLRALRSPLETATLNLLPPPPEESWMAPPDYCPGDNDPITLLRASSAGSLHTIRGTGFGGAAPAVRKDIVPFPHVHTLNATFIHRLVESGGSRTEGAMPYTWRYIRAFPNLKRLALSMDPETRRFSDPWDGYMYGTERLEALDQVRAANREDVAALRRRGGAWVGLEEVRGGMYALYALGLALVVPRVVVENEVFDADQWMLGAVLADMRPTALVATFSGVQKTFETVSPRGTTLSQPEGTSRLTKIELVVEFDTGEGNVDVGVVLVSHMLDETIQGTMLTPHDRIVYSPTSSASN